MGAGIRHLPTSLARTCSSLTRLQLSIAIILTLLPLSCLASSSANEFNRSLYHSPPSLIATATTTLWAGRATCARPIIDGPSALDSPCVLECLALKPSFNQHQSRRRQEKAAFAAENVHRTKESQSSSFSPLTPALTPVRLHSTSTASTYTAFPASDTHPRLVHSRPKLETRLGKRAVTPSDDQAGLDIDQTAQTQEDAGIKEEDERNKEEALRDEAEKQRAEEDARRAKEEEDRLKKEKADRDAREEAERKRIADENAQKVKEEADRQAAEAARLAKEEADRKAQEDMIRKAQEEADKKTKEQEEADNKKKESGKEDQQDENEDDDHKKDGGHKDDSQLEQNEDRSRTETTTTDKSKMVIAISVASGGVIFAAFVVGLVFTRARQARKRNSARDAYLARKVDLDPIYGPAPPFSGVSRNDDRNSSGPVASAMMGSHPHHSARQSLQFMQDMHHHRHYDEVQDRRDSAWATGMPSLVAAPRPARLSNISHEFEEKQHPHNQHRHTRHSLVPGSLGSEILGHPHQQQQQQQQQQQPAPHRQQFHGRYSMQSHTGRNSPFQEPVLANPPLAISHARRESRPASMISQPHLPPADPMNGAPRF